MPANMYHWISSQPFELSLNTIAARGVAGADNGCQQNEPVRNNSQLSIEPVDPATERKQNPHILSPRRPRKFSRPPNAFPPDFGLATGRAKLTTLIRCWHKASMENLVEEQDWRLY